MAKSKSIFTEAVEYLAALASVAAILGVLYFTWPIREAPELTKEVKTPIARLDLVEMKTWYDRNVGQPQFYKRHDKADRFFKVWHGNKSIIFPLGPMDISEFKREGLRPEEIDWEGGLLQEATRRMTVPKTITPRFDSMMDMIFRIPFDEHRDVGFISGQNVMAEISKEFSNKRFAAFVDGYSRSRRIFTPVLLRNDSGADALNIKVFVNSGQYPGAEFLGIASSEGVGKVAALPAKRSVWFFIRTWNAPVDVGDIFVHQEGERVRGGLLICILVLSAIVLLAWRLASRG